MEMFHPEDWLFKLKRTQKTQLKIHGIHGENSKIPRFFPSSSIPQAFHRAAFTVFISHLSSSAFSGQDLVDHVTIW
jgi:hypothetical protein